MEREIRTILTIDQDTSYLFYLGMILTRLGYKVLTSRNAEEALRMMQDQAPSLVLTDIALPKMNGINLLRKIKETPQFKATPVVILTSETDPGLKDTCLRAGCTAFLNKPVEPDVLYRAVQAASESVPRQHIRLDTSLKVMVGDGTVLGGAIRTEYATALSEGGMYVRTLYPQPVNSLTPVTLFINSREVKAKAMVLYNFTVGQGPFKEPGMGMKFQEIAEGDRFFLKQFIKERLAGDIENPAGR